MVLNYITYALSAVITIMILLFFFYEIWFLRKPNRIIPSGENIVSPANGRIARIVEVNGRNLEIKKGFLGKIRTLTGDVAKKAWLITIIMNPFNVHYQRAPSAGKVISVKYKKGKLFNAVIGAKNMEATLLNEKNEILIRTKHGNMKVIQIAGMLANRIECFVSKNQNIKKGEVIGLIKLGSQVCLIMPKMPGLDILVKEGQHVVDGETIIAKKE
jgi:phosphatidylserine decarboxylase